MTIRSFFEKNRVTFQYIYGGVLIVLIPLLIAANTGYIISKYTSSIDVMIQRQGLSLGRSVYALIKPELSNYELLKKKLLALQQGNSQIAVINLLRPVGGSFEIVASSDEGTKSGSVSSNYYDLALVQPDMDGLATKEGTHWLVAMPVSDEAGMKQGILTIKLSSEIVDELSRENRKASFFMLIGTILFVVFFLMVAVRFWDYALLYKRIKEVDKMKDEFISMASHELRTPITAIKGYSSLMIDGSSGDMSEDAMQNAKIINNAAAGLNSLVEDLLNVSRIEQGRIDLKREEIQPEGIIKEVLDTLRVQADEKKLELVWSPFEEPLPIINVDPARFKQIMVNLVGNAIKYTEKGKVEISASKTKDGSVLEIKVKDTGIGMSALEQERLFEKFYRVRNKKVENIRGTGLGLWITKRLVELMEGKIIVGSIEGTGSQFTLLFPLKKS